jgi:hypothetical protein
LDPNPIVKALSVFLKHQVKALLIGGQACIFYGAAEFSRDVDYAVLADSENLLKVKSALNELGAEGIYVPDLSEEVLKRGHACHFRFPKNEPKGARIDVLGKMRGVDGFAEIWSRKKEIPVSGIGNIPVMGLSDLVQSKKTQRDKDWPMIRRLVEADIFNTPDPPPAEQIRFWLMECRTPDLLVTLRKKFESRSDELLTQRPLLSRALSGNEPVLRDLLKQEEEQERKLDEEYWAPLRRELEQWRRERINLD